MLKRSPSIGMGLMMTVLVLGACGGDGGAEVEPGDEGAIETPTSDAPAAPGAAPGGAAASPGAPAAGGASAEMVTAGQQIFVGQGLCFTCHGQNGQGTPLAPNLADAEWIWVQNPDDQTEMATVIRTGVSQPQQYPAPMPPMGGAQLSDDQLNSVVAYVMSLTP